MAACCNGCGSDETPQSGWGRDEEVIQARRRVVEMDSWEDRRRRDTRFFHEALAPYVDSLRSRVGRRNDVQWDAPVADDTELPEEVFALAHEVMRETMPAGSAPRTERRGHRPRRDLASARRSAAPGRQQDIAGTSSQTTELWDAVQSRQWFDQWLESTAAWKDEEWFDQWMESTAAWQEEGREWFERWEQSTAEWQFLAGWARCDESQEVVMNEAWAELLDKLDRVPTRVRGDWDAEDDFDYVETIRQYAVTPFSWFPRCGGASPFFAAYILANPGEIRFYDDFFTYDLRWDLTGIDLGPRARASILLHEFVHMIDEEIRRLTDAIEIDAAPGVEADGSFTDDDNLMVRDVWVSVSEYRAAYLQYRWLNLSNCEAKQLAAGFLRFYAGWDTENPLVGWRRSFVTWGIQRILTRCLAVVALTIIELAVLIAAASTGNLVILTAAVGIDLATAFVVYSLNAAI